jgi:nicotinamidase-related amidase
MAKSLPSRLPGNSALIVIDVQKTFDLPHRGARNSSGAKASIAHLIAT